MGIDLTGESDNWLQEEVDENLEYDPENYKEQLEGTLKPVLNQLLSQKEIESELSYTEISTQLLEKANEDLEEWYRQELPETDQIENPLEAVEEANRAVAGKIIDTYLERY